MIASPNDLYLLDTGVLLQLARGNHVGRCLDHTYRLREQKYQCLVSYVTHAELFVLAAMRKWGQAKRNLLTRILDCVVTINIDRPGVLAAYVECELHARAATPSRRMGKNDLWIAATAKVAGARLLTLDRDFDPLSGLIDLTYVDQQAIPKDWQPPG